MKAKQWMLLGFVMITVGGLPIGCASRAVQVDNPVLIVPQEFDQIFTASITVLREMKFAIDRQDRRFGIITTHPMAASTLLEPWESDHTTFNQATESTLNYQRRVVYVYIEPAAPSKEIEQSKTDQAQPEEKINITNKPLASLTPVHPDLVDFSAEFRYQLRIKVLWERYSNPSQQLTNAAIGGLRFTRGGSAAGTQVNAQGDEAAFWHVIGRDEYLEKRLIAEILRLSVKINESTADLQTDQPTETSTKPTESTESIESKPAA